MWEQEEGWGCLWLVYAGREAEVCFGDRVSNLSNSQPLSLQALLLLVRPLPILLLSDSRMRF